MLTHDSGFRAVSFFSFWPSEFNLRKIAFRVRRSMFDVRCSMFDVTPCGDLSVEASAKLEALRGFAIA